MRPPAYVPPAARANAAILALYVAIGGCLLSVGADVRRIVVAGQLRDGRALVDALLGADQLVAVATAAAGLTLVVAMALAARWLAVVRANRAVVGAPLAAPAPLVRAWAALTVLAVAVAAVSLLLGTADDVAQRQRIDVLRVVGALLAAAALGLAIALVAAITRRQASLGAAAQLPAAPPRAGAESGLTVVSEEQARRER